MKPSKDSEGSAESKLLHKYKEFAGFFDKVKAGTLPEHRPYDCPIDLQPGKEPPWGPIYNTSPIELEVLQEYIDKRIHSTFKVSCRGTYFLCEKERWLTSSSRGLSGIE